MTVAKIIMPEFQVYLAVSPKLDHKRHVLLG